MANIQKRGNGYRISVSIGYDTSGKKLRETTTFIPDDSQTPKQQQKALEKAVYEFEERVKNGKFLKGEKITLNDFIEYWKKEYANQHLEKTTLEDYYAEINSKIIPALGHLKVAKIKPMHLQSFYNNLMEDGIRKDGKKGGYSDATIRKNHAVISSLLSCAVQWQVIEANPCDRVSPPKTKKEKEDYSNDVKHFTLEQAEAFLNALEMDYVTTYKAHDRIDDTGKKYKVKQYTETRSIPFQFKIFFNLALFGGVRRGELIALTWDDIDFDDKSISISKSTGYANHQMITKATKNKSSIRTITVPAPIMELLKKYKTEQKIYKVSIGDQWQGGQGDNWQDKTNIFIQWNGSQMNLASPYKAFKDILKKYNATVKEETEKLPNIPLHGLSYPNLNKIQTFCLNASFYLTWHKKGLDFIY